MQGIPKIEQRVLAVAIILAAGHLLLIAWAALRLGINVPTCLVDDPKTFEASFEKVGDKRYQAHMVAAMWRYEPHTLRLPVGSTLDVFLASRDVLHGFFIKDTMVNLMAIPGTVGNAQVTFPRAGKYPIICHEYCGGGHHTMMGMVEVVDGLEEAEALGIPDTDEEEVDPNDPEAVAVAAGKKLAVSKACIGCHSLDGSRLVGPTFKGVFGRDEKLVDGSTVTIDEAFLRESIKEPNKAVAAGFVPGMMPPVPLTDEEIDQLIAYLKTL